MYPGLFLDRDGVIIENRPAYVRSWSDVSIIPGALTALVKASSSPYKIVIVTNQSAVGRGIMTMGQAKAINDELMRMIEQAGGRIDAVYMCPHAPQANCSCRKPQPGLITQAAGELSLDLNRSILIGDALSDLLAGRRAGVRKLALVLTGRGKDQALRPKPENLDTIVTYNSLAEALSKMLGQLKQS